MHFVVRIRPTYSLSMLVLVCFRFGFSFQIIMIAAFYKLSVLLWDLLFSDMSFCFRRADVRYCMPDGDGIMDMRCRPRVCERGT